MISGEYLLATRIARANAGYRFGINYIGSGSFGVEDGITIVGDESGKTLENTMTGNILPIVEIKGKVKVLEDDGSEEHPYKIYI